MIIREALVSDVPQMQIVRIAVKENILSNTDLVTDKDCIDYITNRGKGWIYEIEDELVGFSIADLRQESIWALFVHPLHEKKGIGKQLHDIMMDWYFAQGKQKAWLSTDPNTRAAAFYRLRGWEEVGIKENGEIIFHLTRDKWTSITIENSPK
ncbi:MAG TPA: GNAT family N-acetyltransferase [Flavisolibacter sp.]|nr:GNAT family N-acetyltransferase [Flavisolibacter sp.]